MDVPEDVGLAEAELLPFAVADPKPALPPPPIPPPLGPAELEIEIASAVERGAQGAGAILEDKASAVSV